MTPKVLSTLSGLILGSFALTACQVQPLYGQSTLNDDGSTIAAALAAVDIESPATRLDQVVRNELLFNLGNGAAQSTDDRYTLSLTTRKSFRSVGISDVDFGPAARFVTVTVDYVLRDTKQADPIVASTDSATATYDRVDQEFANIRSEKDAEERAAKAVADKIRLALALALDTPGG